MQNLLPKQGLQGAYNTDFHKLQKNCHLNHMFQINTFYEDLEFSIQSLSSHYAIKSLHTI